MAIDRTEGYLDKIIQLLQDLYTATPLITEDATITGDWTFTNNPTLPIIDNAILPNGSVNPDDITVAFDNGTRTFSYTITGTNYQFYSNYDLYTKTAGESIVISDVEGVHYIYYNGATLSETTTWTNDLITKYTFLAAIYWDATNSKQIYFGREYKHGANLSAAAHLWAHDNLGLQLTNGGVPANVVADGDGSSDTHIQTGLSSTKVADEDAIFSYAAIATSTNKPKYYRDGTNWRIDEDDTAIVTTTGTGRAAYDNSGTLTEVTSGNLVIMHACMTNDTDRPLVFFVGQNMYANRNAARAAVDDEISSLITDGLPIAEFKFIASFIVETKDTYANLAKSRIITTDEGEDYVDLTGTRITPGGSTATINETQFPFWRTLNLLNTI